MDFRFFHLRAQIETWEAGIDKNLVKINQLVSNYESGCLLPEDADISLPCQREIKIDKGACSGSLLGRCFPNRCSLNGTN